MSIKSGFLTLSMREQICLAIIFLTAFSICVTLCIFGSLSYEILKVDYNQKKLYFYDIYKEYIESSFYFQNFYLLEYEEIIKRIQKQIWVFNNVVILNSSISNYDSHFGEEKIINFVDDYSSNNNYNDYLYFLCFPDEDFLNEYNITKDYYCLIISISISLTLYNSYSSLIVTQNIDNAFHLPGI